MKDEYKKVLIGFLTSLILVLIMPFPFWLGWYCLRLAIQELPLLTYKSAFFIVIGLELILGTVKAFLKR